MRLARTKLAGLILVCVGICMYGTWDLWLATRTELPVNIPISMAVGHVRTSEFKLNINAPFTIKVDAQKGTIPFEALNCLLGVWELDRCPDRPSVVNASWVLTSDGRDVARGSSDDHRGGEWTTDSISRELGYFQSQTGRRYVLDVDVLADGSSLTPGNPRLKVEVHPEVYEGHMVMSAILFLAMGLLVVSGAILLIISFIKNRRGRSLLPNA